MYYLLKVLSLGGLSLLMIGYWTFFKPTSAISLSFHNDLVLTVGTILALLIYQPHFVSSYTMNYSKGFRFLNQHRLVFIILPLFFIFLIILTLLQSLGFLDFISEVFYKVFFALTLLGAAYHFSAQSMAATKYLCPVHLKSDSFFFKGKSLLFLTGVFGIFHHASLNGGSFRLFNFSLELFKIEADILLWFKLSILFLHILFIYKYWHLGFSWVPYLAYISWNLSGVFCRDYFYWISIFHALQYLPFYFSKVQLQKIHIHLVNVLASLGLVFVLPNYLNNTFSVGQSYFFVVVLLCLNLHHFAMESVGWRRS